jgi:preprotein translocase subunit SecE
MAGISTYIKESYDELIHKVTWPSWSELQQSSVLVFIASLIIALIVFGMDYAFGRNPSYAFKGLLGFVYDLIGG